MKKPALLLFILAFSLLWSCRESSPEVVLAPVSNLTDTLYIGTYQLAVPSDFKLIRGQGIDSDVGQVVGDQFAFNYDYGWYTRPLENLSPLSYAVTEEIINGHYRQFVRSTDPLVGYARIHWFKISDSIASPFGYNTLSITTDEISPDWQAEAVEVLSAVVPVE